MFVKFSGRKEQASSITPDELTPDRIAVLMESAVIGQACPAGKCIGTLSYDTRFNSPRVACTYKPEEHNRLATDAEIAAHAIEKGVLKEL